MNILVTGGMGFIGSHTVVSLLQNNYNVLIVDDLSNSKEDVKDKIFEITGKMPIFYKGNIKDRVFMGKVFSQNKIDAVIHFAGFKAVGESVKEPLKYYDNNIGGTISLLEAMKNANCKRIVFSSSATVYGEENPIPYVEHFKKSATNPYGSTKVMIEKILEDLYNADNDWSIALLRYFNPIGAHESGLIGENPNGIPNNLFPYIQKVATGQLSELSVFGGDYNTIDGTGVRDYIHVVDLANGHLYALEYLFGKSCCDAFNLGTGKGTSVLQIVKAFIKASGRNVPYKITKRRQGDLPEFYADTKKAKNILGWQAKKTIEDMCVDGWNFAKNSFK